MLEEPVFQRWQEEVFLEDGAFEVIDHGSPFAELRGVKHAEDFFGASPLFVGPRGGNGEGGLDEDDWQAVGKRGGLDDLATAGAIGRRAIEEEARHVRADLGGDFEELREAERAAGEVVRGAEDGGGIAAAAAEASPMRDAFFQMDAPGGLLTGAALKGAEGLEGEIGFVGRDGGIGAGEGHIRACAEVLDLHGITKGETEEAGFDLVKAVRALAEDAEAEIDLGGRKERHGRKSGFSAQKGEHAAGAAFFESVGVVARGV